MHLPSIPREDQEIVQNQSMTAWLFATALSQTQIPTQNQTSVAPAPVKPSPAETNQGHLPGMRIERTMRMLKESTKEKPSRVRILFYGQSITATGQAWWRYVVNDLKKRFPTAKIDAQNIAISGFSAGYLQWNAINDIRIFNPDLIIMHDYGSDADYEILCQNILRRTHAELVIQSDHYVHFPTGKPEDAEADKSTIEHDLHSVWMRTLADKYNFALLDIRHLWWNHLKANNLPAKLFLRDHAHMNEGGDVLMGKLTSDFLVPPKEGVRGLGDGRVKEVWIQPKEWKNNTVTVNGSGNQISVECNGGTDLAMSVRVNDVKPSAITSLYFNGRTSLAWKTWFPMLTHIPLGPSPVVEQWTLTIFESKSAKQFKFRLVGSRTGVDGDGDATQDFVSNSGKILIPSRSWIQWYGNNTPPDGYEVKFSTLGSGVDRIDKGTEFQILGNGYPAGENRLKLISDKPVTKPILIRFYAPALKDQPVVTPK